MILDQVPLLSLRMKTSPSGLICAVNYDDALESYSVMRQQEKTYRCRDYLGRRSSRQREGKVDDDNSQSEETIDVVCREKMCEWSYRVCDHFHTSREIVAFAFSLLDRFVDRCCCDRTAFKLASMTALYMATKLFNAKQISISSLAELSRGEFEMSHIAEMERIILETLEWRLNPPTVQAFIGRLHALLPIEDSEVSRTIYQRASFFSELCVYDYSFVTQDRSLIAVAALLNAMDGIDDAYLSQKLQAEFLSILQSDCSFQVAADALENAQGRLWYLYSCSAQLLDDDILPIHVSKDRSNRQHAVKGIAAIAHSPVSVNNLKGRY